MSRFFSKFLFPVSLVLGLLAMFVIPASASQLAKTEPRLRTEITLASMADVNLDASFTLSGYIEDGYGRPIADKSILFTADDTYLGQAHSDETGYFERKINKPLDAGTYVVTASSKSTHALEAASTSISLKILPAEVDVQTVPPIAGITFQMAGQQFVSNQDGLASVKINQVGKYRLEVLTDQYHKPYQRIEFARWLDESYQSYKDIQVPTDQVIQAGFNIYHLVGQSFVDLTSNPVDPKRVTEFSIRSAQGDYFVFHDGQPHWLPASRVARRATGLEETKLLYSILDVTVDGSNVVNKSQQRFYTHPDDTWSISLILYSLHISAFDGLFGFATGKSVNIQYPDGDIVNYPLNRNGQVDVSLLARGTYYFEIVGANGLSNRAPVALSRDQEVNTKVITYLDLFVVGMIGILAALGILLYGRPWLIHALLKNNHPVAVQEEIPESAPATSLVEMRPLLDEKQLSYESVRALDREVAKNAVDDSQKNFEKMLAILRKESHFTNKRSKLSLADQLAITLMYVQDHRTPAQIGGEYRVSASTVRRTIKKVKEALANLNEQHLLEGEFFQQEECMTSVENTLPSAGSHRSPGSGCVDWL